MIYERLLQAMGRKKLFALLVDPDKSDPGHLKELLTAASNSNVFMLLIGGSLVSKDIPLFIEEVRQLTSLPIVLFPGSSTQFSGNADAILLLSLISGRNPDYLIGNHVKVSVAIKRSGIEVIPTGYILVDGGRLTSVQYVSNTIPIPRDKTEIAVSTALAGEQLGLKAIYLEAGSGARHPVPVEMIAAVRQAITIPLIVGGGLRSRDQVLTTWGAGADVVVVGNALENAPQNLSSLAL